MAKPAINIQDLFDMPKSVIYNPDGYKPVKEIITDSRIVKKGSMFVAIEGEKYDGHEFINSAIENGASAILINENKLDKCGDTEATVITVPDTVKAYGYLANVWRKKLNIKIISLTGSNGKTTTKEIIATLLAEKYKVLKTEANNNNHLGVPLTILSAEKKHEVIVLEHGTNHFGETKYTAEIALPDVALVTNIGDSHLEFLKNRKGVFEEKSALLDETVKNKGKILINNDDPFLINYKTDYKNRTTYSFGNDSEIKGKITGFSDDGKTKIEIVKGKTRIETVLPLYGESNAKNYLAAVTVALKMGLSKEEILSGTKKLKAVYKRLNVTKKRDLMIIDDTYNSNPDSMRSALDLMEKITKYPKKIFVAGDMFELGKDAKKLHIGLAENIVKSGINIFLSIGENMKYLSEKLKSAQLEKQHFADRDLLIKYLNDYDFKNSAVLFKGSRGMKMEEFADLLKERYI